MQQKARFRNGQINREQGQFRRFSRLNQDLYDANIQGVVAYAVFYPTVELLSSVAIALIIAIAVRLRAGQIQTVDWAEKPNLIRDLVDISIFKNPQDLPRNSLLGCLKSLEPKSPPGLPAGLRFARCITYLKDCGSICGLL